MRWWGFILADLFYIILKTAVNVVLMTADGEDVTCKTVHNHTETESRENLLK